MVSREPGEQVESCLRQKHRSRPGAISQRAYRWLVLAALLLAAGCGGGGSESAPTAEPPMPTATATVELESPTAPATADIANEETLTPNNTVTIATPGLPATPTISIPQVIEADSECSVEYDLDLAGYPELKLKMGCALSPAESNPVGINEFGSGPDYDRFMLWFSADSQIYVLFPDGRWQAYRDIWTEEQPEFSCNPLNVAPASPPLPRRGFGKLWCDVEGIQDTMGLIDREERLCQHVVVQRFEKGRMLACFEDATIRYFRLLDDGTWDMTIVQ